LKNEVSSVAEVIQTQWNLYHCIICTACEQAPNVASGYRANCRYFCVVV